MKKYVVPSMEILDIKNDAIYTGCPVDLHNALRSGSGEGGDGNGGRGNETGGPSKVCTSNCSSNESSW